jgi:hypothetical protein
MATGQEHEDLDFKEKDVSFTPPSGIIRFRKEETGMLEIVAYGVLGAMIMAASLILWWFVRLVE